MVYEAANDNYMIQEKPKKLAPVKKRTKASKKNASVDEEAAE